MTTFMRWVVRFVQRPRSRAVWAGLMTLAVGCGEDLAQPAYPDAGASNDTSAAEDVTISGEDVPARDTSTDHTADSGASDDRSAGADVVSAMDVPSADHSVATDAPIDRGATVVDVVTDRGVAVVDQPTVDVPRDAGSPVVDAPRPDVVVVPDAGGCAGAAPVVTINAPTMNEAIETCSASGAAVFYNFTANVTAGAALRSVTGQWRTPAGTLAPPNYPPLTTAPFAWRRQVGGTMTDTPPLAVFPEALRGTWRFEVTALDACGRMSTATRAFTLTYTMRRCPNP